MLRISGIVFLILAACAFLADFSQGGVLNMMSFAQIWAEVHLPSLIGLQSGLENRVAPDAFLNYALPVLELPAAMTLCALGAFLLALGFGARPRI